MPPRADYYAILNPVANRGRAVRFGPRIEAAFRKTGRSVEIATTRSPGHGLDLARAATEQGRPGIIAVGGDGILHEVVNGIMLAPGDGPRPAVGVIPAGSGNDFAKMLHLPTALDAAVARIVAAVPRAVDIGRVNQWTRASGKPAPWFFVNGIGLGFDAQVGAQASRLRWMGGTLMYGAALLRVLAKLGSPRVRVSIDGRDAVDRPLMLATISNGACHGGTFWMCPHAVIDDGLFEVLIADARGVPAVMRLIPRVMRGTHLGEAGVAVLRGSRVVVSCDDPLPIHADGEIVGDGVREIEMEMVPGALTVLA